MFLTPTPLRIKELFLPAFVVALSLMSACSDSESIGNFSDPKLVYPVEQPILFEGALYEYDPEKKETSLIADLSSAEFVLLDTDRAVPINDYLSRPFLNRNPLPNYLSYVNNNQLFVLDLQTRVTHLLHDFSTQTNSNGPERICRLTKSIVAEPESFESEKVNFADDTIINVETRPLESGCDENEDRSFYAVRIRESEKGFRIRLPSSSDRSVIEDKVFPYLRGELTITEEALMYAGKPFIRPDEEIILHLGYTTTPPSLHAYLTDANSNNLNDTKPIKLWSESGDPFLKQALERIDVLSKDGIDNLTNRGPSYRESNDSLTTQYGNDLVRLSLESLLDDDAVAQRVTALSNPIIDLPESPELNFQEILFSAGNEEIFFSYQNQLFYSFSSQTSVASIDLEESGILSKNILLAGSSILVEKKYAGSDDHSIVALDSSGIESTIVARNDETTHIDNYGSNAPPTVTTENSSNLSWDTYIYPNSAGRNPLDDGTNNTIAVKLYDARLYFDHDEPTSEKFALFRSEIQDNLHSISALTSPTLYQYTGTPNSAVGETMALLEQDLVPHEDNYIYLFTDTYGLAILHVLVDGSPQKRYFYFDPVNTISEPESPSSMEMIPLPY